MASKKQIKKEKKVLLYAGGILFLGFFGFMYVWKQKVSSGNGVNPAPAA